MTQTITRYFLIFLFFTTTIYSQNYQISGFVVDENESGLSYANVVLLQVEDNSILTGTTSDENGFYLIQNIPEGNYIVNVSFIGYQEEQFSITVDRQIEMGVIQLSEITEALEEINIVVKKPTLTQEPDRLSFNVANTALIEGSTLNVLKSTPSLLVINNSISVKNAPTEVYINGRKVHLTSQELVEFLDSTPASSITSIEVITNPPASYDASSGTVVNIIMDKNPNPGYRGNVFGNYTQGIYPRYSAGTSHFFKGEKTEFNVAYSYKQQKENVDNRYLSNYRDAGGSLEETWDSDIDRTIRSKAHTANANFNYNFSDRSNILLSSSISYTPLYDYIIDNQSDILNPDSSLNYELNSLNNTNRDKFIGNFDADYQYRFADDSKISLNGHFTLYDYNDFQEVENDYLNPSGSIFDSKSFYSDSNQDTKIVTASVDYAFKPSSKGQLSSGGKVSYITTDSNIERFDYINGNPEFNTNFSNRFDYKETVIAGYLTYERNWDKFSMNLGLRGEQTFVEGISANTAENTNQEYLELFPSASLSYQISDYTSVYANYKRSIDRPSYEFLNPFSRFLNENTIVKGNPNLRPSFLEKAEIGVSFLKHFTVDLYYSIDKGKYYELILQDNATKSILITPLNLGRHVDYGIDLMFSKSFSENWYLYALTSFYNIKEEMFVEGQQVEMSLWSNYSILMNNWSFLEDNSLNVSLSMTFIGRAISNFSTYLVNNLYTNLSISKNILKGKGAISLIANDLFNMEDYSWETKYLSQDSRFTHDQDTRYVGVGFRYNFGNSGLDVKESKEKSDEQKRLEKNKQTP